MHTTDSLIRSSDRSGVRLTQPPLQSLAPRYTTGASRQGNRLVRFS
jgi:hypothetical protein